MPGQEVRERKKHRNERRCERRDEGKRERDHVNLNVVVRCTILCMPVRDQGPEPKNSHQNPFLLHSSIGQKLLNRSDRLRLNSCSNVLFWRGLPAWRTTP
jgi:hypothetical protein